MAFPRLLILFAAGSILILTGCPMGPQPYIKSGFVPPRRVVVLPMDNHTNDLNGPDVVRYWFDERLREKKGYQTVSLQEIDSKLKEIGISDGGQLPVVSKEKLQALFQADAVIYGDLLDFNYHTTGFLNVRKVKASFKMVDSATGETLWQAEGLGANSEGGFSSAAALQLGLKSLGTQLVEKASNSPLKTETWDMIWNAIEDLPAAR